MVQTKYSIIIFKLIDEIICDSTFITYDIMLYVMTSQYKLGCGQQGAVEILYHDY